MLDLDLLAKKGPCKKFPIGQQIPSVGDSSEKVMYILISGRVDIFNVSSGLFTPAGSMNPGDAFGGYEFFDAPGERVYITSADSTVFIISEKSLNSIAKAEPQIMIELLRSAYGGAKKHDDKPSKDSQKEESAAAESTQEENTQEEKEDTAPKKSSLQIISGELFPEGHKGYPGITKPEYGKLVYKKGYTCAFCKKTFEDYKIFQSKLYQSKPIRYDLRKYFSDFQVEWYEIVTCPHCYYSMFFSFYNEPKTFSKPKMEKELIAAKKSIKLDFSAERDIDHVFAIHYLTLVCAPGYLLNYRHINAKVWANLSWLYEDVEDEEMARMAAEKAAEAYETLYMESRLSPAQEQSTCLTIAGMMFRAGKFDNIKKYLFNAKTNKMGSRVYADLAEDLMDEIRTMDK